MFTLYKSTPIVNKLSRPHGDDIRSSIALNRNPRCVAQQNKVSCSCHVQSCFLSTRPTKALLEKNRNRNRNKTISYLCIDNTQSSSIPSRPHRNAMRKTHTLPCCSTHTHFTPNPPQTKRRSAKPARNDTCDKHVGRPFHHQDKVRHRRRVHRAPRTRPQDHRQLRHNPRRIDVALEYLRVPCERVHTFLNARSAGVVQSDHGTAHLRGHTGRPENTRVGGEAGRGSRKVVLRLALYPYHPGTEVARSALVFR